MTLRLFAFIALVLGMAACQPSANQVDFQADDTRTADDIAEPTG